MCDYVNRAMNMNVGMNEDIRVQISVETGECNNKQQPPSSPMVSIQLPLVYRAEFKRARV